MGYISNNPNLIVVDAILTKKGRELQAAGRALNITKFALADDEIDYSLYNTTHPSGSAYYGEAIEKLPLIEALPDENKMMKYKLITKEEATITTGIPVISTSSTSYTLIAGQGGANGLEIAPVTVNGTNPNGYKFIIPDARLFSSITPTFANGDFEYNASGDSSGNGKTFSNVTKLKLVPILDNADALYAALGLAYTSPESLKNNYKSYIFIEGETSGGRIKVEIVFSASSSTAV